MENTEQRHTMPRPEDQDGELFRVQEKTLHEPKKLLIEGHIEKNREKIKAKINIKQLEEEAKLEEQKIKEHERALNFAIQEEARIKAMLEEALLSTDALIRQFIEEYSRTSFLRKNARVEDFFRDYFIRQQKQIPEPTYVKTHFAEEKLVKEKAGREGIGQTLLNIHNKVKHFVEEYRRAHFWVKRRTVEKFSSEYLQDQNFAFFVSTLRTKKRTHGL